MDGTCFICLIITAETWISIIVLSSYRVQTLASRNISWIFCRMVRHSQFDSKHLCLQLNQNITLPLRCKNNELSHYLQLQWTINSRKLHKINVHLCISCWWTTLFDCFLHRNGPGSIFQGRATQSQLVYRQILTRENKYISVTNKISICFRYWQKLRPFAQRNL